MLPEVSRCRSGQQSSMLTEAYPAASIPLDFSASPTSSSSEPLMLQWKAFHDDQPGARAQRAAHQVSASAQRPAQRRVRSARQERKTAQEWGQRVRRPAPMGGTAAAPF